MGGEEEDVRHREVPETVYSVHESVVGSEGEDADAGQGNSEEVPQGERAETAADGAGGAGGAGVGDLRQGSCVYVGCLLKRERFVSAPAE